MSDLPDIEDMENELDELTGESGDSSKIDQKVGEKLSGSSKESALGHIAVSQGLQIGRDEQFIHSYIWTDNREDVRVGDYVQVPVGGEDETAYLFAVVHTLNYVTDAITLDDLDDLALAGGSGVDMSRYPLVALLDPITILRPEESEESGIARRPVDTLPRPFATMSPVEDREHIYRGLNLPSRGIPAGKLSVGGKLVTDSTGSDIVYNILDPEAGSARDPAIFRHMLVAGATGKGKTQMSKNILRQFAGGPEGPRYQIEESDGNTPNKQPCTVIIDPENEYSGLAKDNPELDEEQEELLAKYDNEGFQVGGVEDCCAFVADVRNADEVKTDAHSTYNFSIPFEVVKGRYQLLLPFSAGDPTKNAIRTIINEYFSTLENDSDATYEGFINWVKRPEIRERFVDEGSIHESSWEAMIGRIEDSAFYRVFDRGSTPITEIEDELFREGRVSVIPTDHIQGRSESLIVMTILSYIVDNKLKSYNSVDQIKETPILLCVDEAHNYLSNTGDAQEAYIINKFIKAAKQGRKEKLGLYMVTQNPVDIYEEIRHQTNTKMYLGLEPATLREIEVPPDFTDRIPVFGRGQAVIKAPDVEAVELQGLPICLTKH